MPVAKKQAAKRKTRSRAPERRVTENMTVAAGPSAIFEFVAPAPTEQSTAEPAPTDAVLALLHEIKGDVREIKGDVGALGQRVGRLENATPQMVPMGDPPRALPLSLVRPSELREVRGVPTPLPGGGLDTGVRASLPVGTDGLELPPAFLAQHPPPYRIGQSVRINPDAEVTGSEGRPWREALGDQPGAGTVLRIQRYSQGHRMWKYSVRIPGMTQANGAGFYESELMPA